MNIHVALELKKFGRRLICRQQHLVKFYNYLNKEIFILATSSSSLFQPCSKASSWIPASTKIADRIFLHFGSYVCLK